MTTKRLILMLLVMLMSVTGAWAQEPTKLHLTYVEDNGRGAIQEPVNAFDGDLTTCTNVDFRGFDSTNPYITFKTDFPVRVNQLSIHYVDYFLYITGFELKGLKNEGGDWDTQSTSMLQETNLGDPTWGIPMDFVHGPLNITCNPEDRYQYFRIYFNSATEDHVLITEIELYVTCDHSYPAGTNVCSKCGYKDESVLHEHVYSSDWSYDKDGHWQTCSGTVGICNSPRGNYASHSDGLTCSVCGMPHCHQLDDAGSCRVDGCGYSVSSISQDLFEALENYGGSSSSSFNNLGNLFDGNTDTKWQARVTATAIFQTQVPVRIDGYSFHSVDADYYHPHPKSWTLYGYDETANTWQIVHSVIDASPSNGWNNYRFINNDGPLYSYYKLEITKLQKDHVACNTNIGGLALDIRPVADHTHISSSEWYSDNFGHWHKCVGEGICNEPKRDYAVHQINGGLSCICGLQHSHQLNNANGKCSVSGCNYILGDVPSGFISSVNEYGGSTSTGASVGNLFDGNTDTKWRSGLKGTAIFKTQVPVRINGYSYHSETDNLLPHPKSWTLYGYDETASAWQIVHSVADASPSNGWNNYRFVNNDGPLYSYYKLEITKLQNDHLACNTNIGSLILDIEPVAGHTHISSSEWYSDNFGHWHKCEGEGLCLEQKRDYSVHQFNGGLSCTCGLQHSHQLNVVDGRCNVSGCGYSVDDIPSGFISSVNEYGGSISTEDASVGNLFDGNTDTKWESGLTATAIFKTQVPVRIDGYSFHSVAGGSFSPHPKSWTLYGYDETASAWQIVHSMADASPSNGWNNYRFVNNDGPLYSYYKLEITRLQIDLYPSKTNIGGLTLDIQPVADHTHISSSEWYSDNFGHWHKCEGEGICNEPKRDYAVHQINGGLSCACGLQHSHQFNNADGKCSVSGCGYSVDDIPSGFISSVNEYGGSTSTEDASVGNLFDGNTDTKWQAGVKATAIFKTQTPVRIDGYSFHSNGDYIGDWLHPHPKSWTLYGYDKTANTWQIVHSVADASPSNGWNNYRFVNNDGPLYSHFKLEVTKLQDDHVACKTNIGGLTLDIIHEHNYADSWSSNDAYHWHECTSEGGKCNNPRVQEGEHVYDNTATAGTVPYYTCSVCGYIDPVRQHVHHYVASEVTTEGHVCVCTSEVGECTVPEIRGGHTLEVVDGTYVCSLCGWTHEHNYMWIHDETKHWHECDGEGECNARTKDEAEHNIHESILCDTENYMCDVCQYVDEEKKAQFGADRDYLSMKAVGGDVRIGFKNQGTPDSYTIQVSEDGNHWSEPQTLNTETTLATIPEGETYYFRHGMTTSIEKISKSQNSHWYFTMSSVSNDAAVEAGGNVMSMLNMTCQKNSMSGYPNQHMFTGLFKDCALLTVAPKLPATTIGQFCYMYMFEGTNITTAPELPATTIPDGAYNGMFRNCKKLENVSPLPGTRLSRRAYNEMFYGCEKLTTVEIANITSVDLRTDASNASFYNWLEETAADTNGKVIAPIEMMGHSLIFLPSNWQWATKLKANEDPDNDGNFYTTFFDSRYDYKVEDGFKAYTGIITTTEGDERELRLTATPDKIIPKGDGVIIHGGSGEVLLTVSDGSAERVDGNVLTGSDTDTTAPSHCYILSYGQLGLGFYQYAQGKTLSAHKAYLVYEKPSGAKALRMVFADDEVDGIERISDDSANSSTGIYSISGVRLNKLQKGINIVNGKKIIVK